MTLGWNITAAIFAVFSLVYLYLTRHFKYWTNRKVAGPNPVPFWGNFRDVLMQKKSPGDFLQEMYQNHVGFPFVGFYVMDKPALLLRDPEVIKHVLVKDFNYFSDRNSEASMETDPLMARGLFTSNGQQWKQSRGQISPVFTSGKLKKMFGLVMECSTELKKYLTDSAKESKPVEVKEIAGKSFTDVITSCAFGINSNCISNPTAEFREFGRSVFEYNTFKSLANTSMFFMPWLAKLMRIAFISKETTKFLREVIGDTITAREESKTTRHDLIDQLIVLKNKGKMAKEKDDDSTVKMNGGIGDKAAQKQFDFIDICADDLVAHAATFFSAGFETSSSTATFALYELAMAPHTQTKVRQEINEVIDRYKGQLTYEGVQDMKYLDMVVSETLRKYATLPFLDRVCLEDYTIPGTDVTIEKGTPIFIPISGLHYDPDLFPDPETFNPDRFSDDQKDSITPYSYLPFGEGPRICIGMRFGLMAVKTQLANILSLIEVQVCADTPIPLVYNPKGSLLTLKAGLPLIFKQIK